MKNNANNIFTFTAPNGVEVTAVMLKNYNRKLRENYFGSWECVVYAQNKLFTCKMTFKRMYFAGQVPQGKDNPVVLDKILNVEVFVDHAILPDYDELLARYNDIEVAQAETNIGM